MAKFSGSCPDIGATSRSSRLDSKTVDRKSKKVKRTLHCCYCGKACEKIELHLMHDHPKEPKVIEALHFSNTLEERKRLLSLLCSSKKLKHDYTIRNKKDEDLVHCIFCQGYYHRSQFWKHALICEQKKFTEPGSSTDLPNSRPILEQKNCNPKSGNLNFRNTVQQAIPETMSLSSPKAERDTTHYLNSVSPISEAVSTKINPIPDHGSDNLSILYAGNSSEMMNLDSESSGPLILDSLHSVLECTSTPVQESCPSTVQEALVENPKSPCPDLSEEECQSTLEHETGRSNILQPHTPVLSRSYLLDNGSSSLQQNTDKICQSSSTHMLDCRGKHVTPQESVCHVYTDSSDPQPTTNLKPDWTTIPTTVSHSEQNLGSHTEPERSAIMMPELRSERSTKSNPHSESTNCLVGNICSSDEQNIANPETENLFIRVFGNDEHRGPEIESHCHLIPNKIPNEKRTTDPETAKKQFDCEGHIGADAEEGGKCPGQARDLKPLGLNSTTTVKRKWDSRSRDTKRRRQSDPLQVHLLC